MPRKHKITLRTGSAAPSAADFAVSEPAWDSTNKKLYIKAADGTMVEINQTQSSVDPVIMGMIF